LVLISIFASFKGDALTLNKNIVLIGFSGTGKTSVGKLVSEKLQLNYVDIDDEIKKRCSMNIGEIFEKHGETFFRKIEAEIVREFSNTQDYVISTGGGVVLNSANIDSLKENSIIFWLRGSVDTIIDNLKKDSLRMKDRPLLKTENLYQRITQLMHDREQYYNKYYDYEVCIDKLSLMEVADTVIGLLNHDKIKPEASFIDFCEQFPDKELFTFISKNNHPVSLTGRELDRKIKILGGVLQERFASQEKALLLFEQGLEYIYSLFSCWYANVVAIPISVNNLSAPEKIAEKINAILSDSQAKVIITNTGFAEFLGTQPAFSAVPVLNVDEITRIENDSASKARLFAPDDLGLLLYTSGSTSQPKGVMISHQNLMARALRGGNLWDIHQESRIVSWMPQFHSFGLDFSILTPLSKGASCIIFSPAGFLEEPENWFRLIHQYQATHTGAPNFAYDYCCSAIDITAVQDLSLHSLQAIVCGGEPVRKETYENFSKKFRNLGLKDTVFCPEYGLSEAGSVVTKKPGQPLYFLTLDIPSLEQGIVKHTQRKNKSKSVTSCGEIGEGVDIRIVHPETSEPCPVCQVGEIWLKCPSVARGYFSLEPETNQAFSGVLGNSPEDGFLRTGDLGFIEDNRLYVVGRRKEVIIIHGKNHHPVDIEWTIQKHIPEFTLPVAVFAWEMNNEEKVVVVQEVENPLNEPEYARLVQRIITAVSENHELEIYEIDLIEKGGIPKTGSGKVQRKVCRDSYINQELPVLYRHQQGSSGLKSRANESSAVKNQHIIDALKREVFLPLLKIDDHRMEAATNLSELGLDSIQYVRIAKQIEAVFKLPFTPVLLFKYRSFEKLALYLAAQIGEPQVQTVNHGKTPHNAFINPSGISDRDIAIIGVSVHFPGGVVDLESFWENLAGQKDGITPITESRPLIITEDQNYYGDSKVSFPQWGGFIEDVASFDASFFKISPLEAECMDPQQRKLLELTWHVIEDSGYSPSQLADKDIGLFVGVHNNDYAELAGRQPALTGTYGTFLDSGLHMSMIAHRVSRWFNFHGPSEIINTACSSSLVAVHHAVESIYRGESSLAIAGGINLILLSRVYRASQEANMLSKDGRCKTFDEQADGFVRAEGYGAVLLKPLSQAIKDRNTVYGIIKRAVINHDGQSNSLRAPNLNAQKQLIKSAYQVSGLPLETIGFIEAHGTGTALGDPIEVQALQEAFREINPDLPEAFCGLGTVKTNIGHCESAAGIAGLIKVLLSMKHGTLPGIRNFNKLNPYIQLQGTPFYIVDQTREWKRFKDSNGQEIPLRAGISSFGLGGANAHVVIEEYIPANCVQQTSSISVNPVIIPISAKNQECLGTYVQKLHDFLVKSFIKGQDPDQCSGNIDLSELAYTLQAGREAMEERIAFIAKDMQEFIHQLESFNQGIEPVKDCWQGRVKQGKELIALLGSDEDSQELIGKWILKEKLDKIVQYWVQGGTIDWDSLYDQAKPRRINLPTYPFAKEYYWIPELNSKSGRIIPQMTAAYAYSPVLHPLLQQNTSDFSEQRFSSTFTGEEFFLKDHCFHGKRILPGVAYLEMARAAAEVAAGTLAEKPMGIRLKDIVWLRPIVAGERPVQIHIGLFPEDSTRQGGEIAFEIYSSPCERGILHSQDETFGYEVNNEDGTKPVVVYSQGTVMMSALTEVPTLNLKALQDQYTKETLSTTEIYEFFRTIGINYGSSYQGIEKVYQGQDQVLAKISLPVTIADTLNQFVLHPCILDSAIQATVGLKAGLDDHKPILAFALEEIEVFNKCAATMWALIRYSNDGQIDSKIHIHECIQKYDIDLCDEQGVICVRIKGYTSRVIERLIPADNMPEAVFSPGFNEPWVGNIMRIPVWDVVSVKQGQTASSPTGQMVIVGGTKSNRSLIKQHYPKARVLEIKSQDTIDTMVNKLNAYNSIDQILWIAPYQPLQSPADDSLIEDQNQGVLLVFRMIKALLHLGFGNKDLAFSIITIQVQPIHKNDAVNPTHASVHGLVGSLAKEYPNWKLRLIDLEAGAPENWPIVDILSLPWDIQGDPIVYRDGEWYRQKLIPFQHQLPNRTLYRSGGVYIVIGGAGGIGEVWSEYMIRTYQARIIWIGRREMNEIIRGKLDRLAGMGPAPLYFTADATDRKALEQIYKEVKEQYSQIHGVIHSAVGILDQSLANMEEEQFRAGLAVKVDVSVRIAQVFQQDSLDFVMFFSSVINFSKDHGKSGYASGCAFKDVFAHQLALEWPCAVKVINWGYWGNVGIGRAVPQAFKNRLEQLGVGSIDPSEAMKTLEILLDGPINQIVLVNSMKPVDDFEPELITVYPSAIPSIIRDIKNDNHNLLVKWFPAAAAKTPPETNLPEKEMEEFLCKLLWGQLQSLGLFAFQNIPLESNMAIADFKTRLGHLYNRWLDESITVLARRNYLVYDGKTCTVAEQGLIDMDTLWNEWDHRKSVWLEDPRIKAQVILVEETLRALPEILTGKVPATEIMFPNSSMELVEGIYKNNPVSDYFNEVLADTVAAYIEERVKFDPSALVRIIEIGAGTGGTSTMVFQKLKPYQAHIQEYCYTDISKAFLIHAEKEYGPENPYLTYQLFNVEASIAGQEISAGEYDLVIATNVLHATQNIRQTLQNAKATLKKNGLILLNEISHNSLFIHLTFGLLEGWWRYEDSNLRIPGCPGLYPKTWQAVLESEGFQSVFFPAQEAHDLSQQIIVAESDGIIRQKQPRMCVLTQNWSSESRTAENRTMQKLPATPAGSIKPDSLREKSTAYFKKLIGETLRIPYHKINAAEPLETYGIDSILVVQLNNVLRKVFDNVSSTLFFECQTIDALVDHFIQNQPEALIQLFGFETQGVSAKPSGDEIRNEPSLVESFPNFRRPGHVHPFRNLQDRKPEAPSAREPIAIIGMSGRYPQANTLTEYWENLKAGKDCITEIPEERWPLQGFYHPDPEEAVEQGKSYSKWGGFIEGFADFDPLFFNISPRETLNMDPQERLFIQSCWEVLEDAGYTREQLAAQYHGRVGVFVGITRTGFELFGPDLWKRGESIFPRTSFSSVANRISYLLNLQGPSMPIDTMCSSSLTALHEAGEYLHRGECDLAIAGGVNLYLHPSSYIDLCGQRMLSVDGRCKSFGRGSNGFIPGEGVGAILLKRLSRAIADQDHIYAIIRGTSINHGGKTNGYTVPNPVAQRDLIRAALEKSGVNARAISYIEAHGTGTELGDPIEITGLTQAFHKDTEDTGYCAIGSVKSNIGHLEAAAGIAGLTKIVLQMKHRQIVPSLHARELNPNINFAETPFVVQQELAEWKQPVIENSGDAKKYPRIAGISSFGAGGSNAHVVIEEYIPKELEQVPIRIDTRSQTAQGRSAQQRVIIILSARNEERLKEQVRQILTVIKEQQFSNHNLANIAYTLQVGREAMEERLGLIVGSMKELEDKLQSFLEGRDNIDDLFRGLVKRNQDSLAVLAADEEMREAVDKWIERQKYGKLLETWVKGLTFDWNKLYHGFKPHRISLPTYPFAKESYWLPVIKDDSLRLASGNGSGTVERTSPLLHRIVPRETARLELGIVYETILTPEHSAIAGHMVGGQPVLPAVAYIEMIRAAMKELAGNTSVEIEELDCLQSLVVSSETVIQLVLRGIGKNHYHFQILRNGSEPEIYCQGKVIANEVTEDVYIDYQALQKIGILRANMEPLYERFLLLGTEYKGAYCSLQRLWINTEEVLGELQLRDSYGESGYSCHPGLLDSAIQMRIELSGGISGIDQVAGMKGVKVNADIPSRIFSYLKPANNGKYYQVVLLDSNGKVIIQIQQLMTRKLTNPSDELMYLPIWEEHPTESAMEQDSIQTVLIVYSDPSANFEKTIRNYYQKNKNAGKVIQIQLSNYTQKVSEQEWRCDIHDPKGFETCLGEYVSIGCIYFISDCQANEKPFDFNGLAQSQQYNEIQLLRLIKCLNQKGPVNQVIDCYIITQDNYRLTDTRLNPYGGGITGLAYSIAQGEPRFSVRNIDISAEDLITEQGRDVLLRLILTTKPSDRGEVTKLQSGGRYRQVFLKLDAGCFKNARTRSGLRKGGVYVILGGSGTIGMAITRYLMQKYHAKTVWIGRKPETSEVIQEKIESLRGLGELPFYIQADVTNWDQMKDIITTMKKRFSTINGAIFSGLVFKFAKLNRISENEFLKILNVKTIGSLNFYRAFQDEPLDFMGYLSSIQAFSFTEAASSAAYASGITFTDSFVQSIKGISKFPVGTINWGYWKSTEENTLLSNIERFEEREGIDCFEHFIRLLQAGVLNQAICLKASKSERELMKCKKDEYISIYKRHSDSMIQSLRNNKTIMEPKVAISIENTTFMELKQWMSKLLFVQIRQLGILLPGDNTEEIDALRKKAGVIDKYNRWFKECLSILETRGYIQSEAGWGNGALVRVLGKPGLDDGDVVWRDWEIIKESYLKDPYWGQQLRPVEACLRELPGILRGKVLATDILFPGSSIEMVAKVYQGNILADYFNNIAADIVAEYVRQRIAADSQAKVRIIEVGAGTGGTSVMVFAKLKPYADHIEYCYTDISKAFLLFAEEKYGPENPYLVYKLWNIEKSLADQGIDAGGYDIAIATNVLHATKNIRQTLRNTKAVLATNGILLLNEIIQKSIFGTITFGLLDGWWLYEDDQLRIPGSPFLNTESWRKVLTEEGFRHIIFPAEASRILGQQVIFAASDGMVRLTAKDNLIQPEVTNVANDILMIKGNNVADDFKIKTNKSRPVPLSRETFAEVAITTTGISDESIEDYVKTTIIDHLSKSLKVPVHSIDSSMAFSDYGVDSIIGVSFIQQVNKKLGVSMNSAIIFDYTTADRLTGYIIKTYREQIQNQMASLLNISSSSAPSPPKVMKSIDGLFETHSPSNDNYDIVPPETDDDELIEILEKKFYTGEISTKSLIAAVINKD
jgi:acyl transferase domain-containing protein/acyl-CoA synthetase (AMP-forming)/AMP-acid ligase II/shikimate kinase/acyl carrier protein/2-polyprenyl-3-methyl-5-hydroxy-6-metoxy-1,4-benzoquinol methylase